MIVAMGRALGALVGFGSFTWGFREPPQAGIGRAFGPRPIRFAALVRRILYCSQAPECPLQSACQRPCLLDGRACEVYFVSGSSFSPNSTCSTLDLAPSPSYIESRYGCVHTGPHFMKRKLLVL